MPNASPLRTSSPRLLLNDLYNTLQDADEDDQADQDDALTILHSVLTHNATLYGHPAPQDADTFAASITEDQRRDLFGFVVVTFTQELTNDTRYIERATFVAPDSIHYGLLEFTLTRPDATASWRIHSITPFKPQGPDDG